MCGMPTVPTFTLKRTLSLTNPAMIGPDVIKLQQLLTEKGFPVAADGEFGHLTADACVEAKRRLRYPKSQQLPIAGQKLVAKLQAHAPFPPPPTPPSRQRYADQMDFAFAHRSNWRYSQIRPIPHTMDAATRITTDCSGGVTLLAQTANLPDPNGRRYDGLGFTGTILDHCSRLAASQVKVGDLIVYGIYPGHHVVAVKEVLGGGDFLVWSHGRNGDPRYIKHSQERASQAANGHVAVYFLRFINE